MRLLISSIILISFCSYGQNEDTNRRVICSGPYDPVREDSIANVGRDWNQTLNQKVFIDSISSEFIEYPYYNWKFYPVQVSFFLNQNDSLRSFNQVFLYTKDKTKIEPNGENRLYNQFFELALRGTFRNGQLWNGRIYVYDSDEMLQRIEIIEKGVYCRDGQL
jgi:hypothetical protein